MLEELEYFKKRILEDSPTLSTNDVEKAAMVLIKQRWKEKDGEWTSRRDLAATLSVAELYDLYKVKGLLPEKPEFGAVARKAQDDFVSYPVNFEIINTAEIVEEVSNPSFLSYITHESTKIKNSKPNDFILLKSVLCTSLPYVNGNNDAFEPDDLVAAVDSGQLDKLQPAIMDWRHDFMVYGNTIGAEVIDAEIEIPGMGKQKVKQIVAYSVFYAWLNQERARKVREWASAGILTFSMACGAERTEYRNINGQVRVLRNPHFVANSIIPPDISPADEHAKLQSIAAKAELNTLYSMPSVIKKQQGDDMNEEMKKLIDEIASLKASLVLAQAQEESIKVAVEKTTGEKAELASKIDELEKSLSAANGILAEFKSKSLESTQASVAEINKSRKEKIAGIDGMSAESVEYWAGKFLASVNGDGQIVDQEEEFAMFMANIPVRKDGVVPKDMVLKVVAAVESGLSVVDSVFDDAEREQVKASMAAAKIAIDEGNENDLEIAITALSTLLTTVSTKSPLVIASQGAIVSALGKNEGLVAKNTMA